MNALGGVRLKLERAEHVIEKLNQSVIAYLAENPYEIIGEFEPEGSEYVLRGRVTKQTAPFSVIAGEITHNLRSALDHLAWQLALLNTPTPFYRTQFPIARSEGEFGSSQGQLMVRDLSPKHRALIETFQPYNRTDENWIPHALRDLRILSNTDKHRVLNATVARQATELEPTYRLIIVRDAIGYSNVTWFSGGPIDGAELARMTLEGVGPDPKVKMEGAIPVTISFDEPTLTGQQPGLVPMLRAILRGVREIISAFEGDL